jgi:sugar phosphate isomerase/epimerase
VFHLKLGVELAGLRLPLKKALHIAAGLGADAVEIDARGEITPRDLSRTGLRQLRKMLADHRLRVSAVSFQTRRGYDTTADLDARIAATKAAMDMAHDLGAPVVVNHIGAIPEDSGSDRWRLMVEVLGELGQHGQKVGALLAAETRTETGQQMARLLAELPEESLAVDFNPGHLVAAGLDPLEVIAAVGPSVRHVHATDGMCEPSTRRGRAALLGEGSADFPALLAALDEHGYRGDFTLSARSSDPVAEIGRAMEYLRSI